MYFARDRHVYVQDGCWEARLSEKQCHQLLDIWESANAPSLFNALCDAMKTAGVDVYHAPLGGPCLRLVAGLSSSVKEA